MVLVQLEEGDIINTRFIRKVYRENHTERGDSYNTYYYYVLFDGDDIPLTICSNDFYNIKKLCKKFS